MVGSNFLTVKTLSIVLLGVVAFILSTCGGLLVGVLMCKLTKGKINPL
ncbi:MAG: sodium ion-translocating decarboxylase subunit beta, partial [Fibrobacter sp.]|nr:sodium ion-translocating decarboxylase subunit beta [Fibrobacter sp.]